MFSAQQAQQAIGAVRPQPDPVPVILTDVALFMLGRAVGKRLFGKDK